MKIVMDSCTVILLAKASVLEKACKTYTCHVTKDIYDEVIKGKEKKFSDALLFERLEKEKKITILNEDSNKTEKIAKDFNMGRGEASTITAGCEHENTIVATDNRQGRKAAKVYSLSLVGSLEIVVSLFKKNNIDLKKAQEALHILKEEGWFENYLIEKTKEDLR